MKLLVYSNNPDRLILFKTLFKDIKSDIKILYTDNLSTLESKLLTYEYELCGTILDFEDIILDEFYKFYKKVAFVFEHFNSLLLFKDSIIHEPYNENFICLCSFERLLNVSNDYIKVSKKQIPITYSLIIENGNTYLEGYHGTNRISSVKVTSFINNKLSFVIDDDYNFRQIAMICMTMFSEYSNINNIFQYIENISFKLRYSGRVYIVNRNMTSADIVNMLKDSNL